MKQRAIAAVGPSGSRSRHALERICERTVYDWRTYGGHSDAFAFLDNCVYFADCTVARYRDFEVRALALDQAARANVTEPTESTARTAKDAWLAAC